MSFRKVLFVFVCVVVGLSFVLFKTAPGDDWQVIYQTDFSSDPGWTANNSTYYHWDSTQGNYYANEVDNSQAYAYKLLPTPLSFSSQWRLTYDILPVSHSWAGNGRLSLIDANLDATSLNHGNITVDFNSEDRGHIVAFTYGSTTKADWLFSVPSQFAEGVQYAVTLDWNPVGQVLNLSIVRKDTATLLWQTSAANVGSFSGIDRLATSAYGDTYAPGASGIIRIDNLALVSKGTTLAVQSTPVAGIVITGDKSGTSDYTAACADGQVVNLTAPVTTVSAGTTYAFVRWTLDGANQTDGQQTLQVTMNAEHTAVAIYEIGQHWVPMSSLLAYRNGLAWLAAASSSMQWAAHQPPSPEGQ